MPVLRYRLKPALYRNSVALMRLAADLQARPGIQQAAALMATPANQAALAESGLAVPAGLHSRGRRPAHRWRPATWKPRWRLAWIGPKTGCCGRPAPLTPARAAERRPRTVAEGIQHLPHANLALISVPGEYAYAEALKALKAGLHVFLFSNGVSLDDELRLKQLAAARGLLLMGPDCGTG